MEWFVEWYREWRERVREAAYMVAACNRAFIWAVSTDQLTNEDIRAVLEARREWNAAGASVAGNYWGSVL